jgi:hypothetical protein
LKGFVLGLNRKATLMPVIPLLILFLGLAPPEPAASSAALVELERTLKSDPAATAFFGSIAQAPFARTPLTRRDASAARTRLAAWYMDRLRRDRADEMMAGTLAEGKLRMPFSTRRFGVRPIGGWSLWISMHGGGGAPKRVNDRQWQNQKRLYQLDDGLYLTPRAPTDTWNLWHEPHIDRLFDRLIENLIAIEGVDSNRVYLMGYSAGGDGVYQLAPRMADRWAAAAMMAGHPNDASPIGLRNVPFALQVGGADDAYDRARIAAEWKAKLGILRTADPSGYDHFVRIPKNKGHWMDLEDRVAIPWMARRQRNPIPERVVWHVGATPRDRQYWLALAADDRKVGTLLDVSRRGSEFIVWQAENVGRFLLLLDDRMTDLDQPVTVRFGSRTLFAGRVSRTIAALADSLSTRGDTRLMFSAGALITLP